MFRVYKTKSVEWKPSAVLALATSADGSQVAAARADGSLEIWLVSPGSVGWHCQLTIHGDPNSRVSSLVWCRSGSRGRPLGRLLSSSLDGLVSEWDLFDLKQKTVLDSIGISIWQMAAEPRDDLQNNTKQVTTSNKHDNGHASTSTNSDTDEEDSSDSGDDDKDIDAVELYDENDYRNTRVAIACDDGCVRIYNVSDEGSLTINRTLPRVAGRTLSVAWSPDANRIYSGSSDGFIRCWDAKFAREIYRITVAHGGLGSGSDLCIGSLLALRCGTVVSGDSSGYVQFWDGQLGTLLQALSYHKGDVSTLAAAPSHNRVFSAGSDGQVVLYNLSRDVSGSGDGKVVHEAIKKWIYVHSVRAHTHDVKAMTVAVPISHEDLPPDEKAKRSRGREKHLKFSYHKWAHLGVPMLISAGVDAKLFAYCANEFTMFSPHDICPAPQRMPMQLVPKTVFKQTALLLIQAAYWVDIYSVQLENSAVTDVSPGASGGLVALNPVKRITCDPAQKIICSAISKSGTSVAYSSSVRPSLIELKSSESENDRLTFIRWKLPRKIPYAHSIIYSSDSTRLVLAGHDRKIYVVDVGSAKLVHTFTPCRSENGDEFSPTEPPITKMFSSIDDQWLAAINCFGDLYIFNLETLRQHWFVSRFEGASVTAGGFTPRNSNILIISTSSNHVYALDVEARQLGEWSMQHTFSLPRRFQEFPGEVTGLSFQPSSSSSSVIVYGPRAMCLIDFGKPVDKDTDTDLANGQGLTKKLSINGVLKRHHPESKYNFQICEFRDPVLLVEYLSTNELLLVQKPWMEVVKNFDTKPVHRDLYGGTS